MCLITLIKHLKCGLQIYNYQTPSKMRQLFIILGIAISIFTASSQTDSTSVEELRSIIASLDTDPATRDRATYMLAEALKNAPGTEVPDLNVILKSGGTSSLREIIDRPSLLIFYDPFCHECHELITELSSNEAFNSAVAGQRLKVVAIYPEWDKESWEEPAEPLPAQWIDTIITPEETDLVYDRFSIPETPSTFLIGCDHSIILKHPDSSQILQALK